MEAHLEGRQLEGTDKVGNIDEHFQAAKDAKYRVKNVKTSLRGRFTSFKIFFESTHTLDEIQRSISTNLFDQWRLEGNVCWLDHRIEGNASLPKLSSPKPDLTYGFPIFKGDDDLPIGLEDFDCARNFSLNCLSTLRQPREDGLCTIKCSLNKGLYKASQKQCRVEELGSYELTCFPWAVVEIKHAHVKNSEVGFCYRQAVNGSAVALRILKSVFMEAYGTVPEDLPPVVAFTCVGPDLRVWLVYIDHELESGQQVMMKCIFATTLELRWGVMAAREIIENMHFWASRVLKPRITAALSIIRAKQATQLSESNLRLTVDVRMKNEEKAKQADDLKKNPPSFFRRISTMTLGSPVMSQQSKPFRKIREGISKLTNKKDSAKKSKESRSGLASTATKDFVDTNKKKTRVALPITERQNTGSNRGAKFRSPHGLTDNESESGSPGTEETGSVAETDGSSYAPSADAEDDDDDESECNQSNAEYGHFNSELRQELQELKEMNRTFLEQDYPSNDEDDASFGSTSDARWTTGARGGSDSHSSFSDRSPADSGADSSDGTDGGSYDEDSAGEAFEEDRTETEEDEAGSEDQSRREQDQAGSEDQSRREQQDQAGSEEDRDERLNTTHAGDGEKRFERASTEESRAEMNTDNDEESKMDNGSDAVSDRSNKSQSTRGQTTFRPHDISIWGQSALRSLEAEKVTKLVSFKAFVEAARCRNLVPCIRTVMFEEEDGESKDSLKSLKLREAFWHSDRTDVNERYLTCITQRLNEGLQLDEDSSRDEVKELRPSMRCKSLLVHALDLLSRHHAKGRVRSIFKAAVSCLAPEELSPVLNSNVFHEYLGRISDLEDEAFAMVNMDSLTSKELPDSEQEHGWTVDGRWVAF